MSTRHISILKRAISLSGALFTIVALVLLGISTYNSDTLGPLLLYVAITSVIGVVILFSTIIANVVQLLRKLSAKEPGARLHFRFVTIFVALALIPIVMISLFTSQLLRQQNWGEDMIEVAVSGSRDLYQTALNERKKRLIRELNEIGKILAQHPDSLIEFFLEEIMDEHQMMQIALYHISGKYISARSLVSSPEALHSLNPLILNQLRQGYDYHELEEHPELGESLIIAIPVYGYLADEEYKTEEPYSRILTAVYPLPSQLEQGRQQIDDAVMQSRKLYYLKEQQQFMHNVGFLLMLFLSLLTALWFALLFTRRLTTPLYDLAKGTQAVAAGIYDQPLRQPAKDDLGFLVESFNDMMLNLESTHQALNKSQQIVKRQNVHLEAVLSRLSSGVIVLDGQHNLIRVNNAACNILESRLSPTPEQPLSLASQYHPQMSVFIKKIESYLKSGETDWHEEIEFENSIGKRILFCRGTLLDNVGAQSGFVIVFDDITEMVSAQRNAAWSEVARRLAHEIKNPLTPIQLSAERLRHRYLEKMNTEEGRVLDRATHTIVQQVDTLKRMVQAFSDYARSPKLQLAPVQPTTLLEEVVDLYQHSATHHKVILDIPSTLPTIYADLDRLRQVLNNLIKNGLESMKKETKQATVHITAAVQTGHLVIEICDNGPGIDLEIQPHLFEPYATTKPKGTGLGLAIVKRIIDEHNGQISFTSAPTGTCFLIQFPLSRRST